MTGKNKKELLKENSELKEELADIKLKYDQLSERIKSLETEFKCNKCDRTSTNSTSVKKHQSRDISLVYKCEQCRKESHLKVCKMNKCDECDKFFKYLKIKKQRSKFPMKTPKYIATFLTMK